MDLSRIVIEAYSKEMEEEEEDAAADGGGEEIVGIGVGRECWQTSWPCR